MTALTFASITPAPTAGDAVQGAASGGADHPCGRGTPATAQGGMADRSAHIDTRSGARDGLSRGAHHRATAVAATPAPTAPSRTKEPRPAPPSLPLSLERARERQRELAASTGAFGMFTAPKPNVTSLPTPAPSAPPAPADRALEPPFARPAPRAALTSEAVKQQAVAWMDSLQEGLASDPPDWVQTIADDIALATAFWR